jgi:acyl carrier protein
MDIRDFGAEKLRKVIADYLEIDVGRVVDEANLSDDLGVDWFDQIDLLVMIEDEFEGVQFSDVAGIEIVSDLIRHIETARPIAAAHRRSAA